jgi:hypothetical protein
MKKRKKYDVTKYEHLLRLIRNTKHHHFFNTETLKNSFGDDQKIITYFLDHYPNLIDHTYKHVKGNMLVFECLKKYFSK